MVTKEKNRLLDIFKYKEGKFPTRYLGLPLAPRILYHKDCEPALIERVRYGDGREMEN